MSADGEQTSFSIWNSTAIFRRLDSERVAVELESVERRLLLTLQSSLAELFEDGGFGIDWEEVSEGALAPGLSLMQVVSTTRQSPGFTRVRLQGDEAARFGVGSLHFRLLLPEHPDAPEWPRISSSGRTVWPEQKIHKSVYTVIAQADDWLDFDIFHHAGSPTCDWVEANPVGQTVGIIGPGAAGARRDRRCCCSATRPRSPRSSACWGWPRARRRPCSPHPRRISALSLRIRAWRAPQISWRR